MRRFSRLSVAILLIAVFAAVMLPVSFAAGELTYTAPAAPTFLAGTTGNKITVDLENSASVELINVSASANLIQDVISGLTIDNIANIAADGGSEAVFTLSIPAIALEGSYTLNAEVTYTVTGDAVPQTLIMAIPFKVKAPMRLSCSISGNSLRAGSSSNLALTLKNGTSANFSEMTVTLEGISGEGIITSSANPAVVGNIDSNGSKTANFTLTSSEKLEAGYYDLEAVVKYKDSSDSTGNIATEKFQFFISVTAATSSSSGVTGGSISIYSANINRQTVKSGDSFQLSVRLNNDAPYSIEHVKVAVSAEEGLSNTSQPAVVLTKISSDSDYTIDFNYIVDDDIKTRFYSLNIAVTYTEDGKEYKYEWPTGIYVKNPAEGEKSDLITLSGVTFSRSELIATDEFAASIVVHNGGNEPVYNLAVSALPDDGVVNKSQNIVMIGTLEAGGSRTLNYTFLSRSSAETSNYMINFTASYQLESGKADSAKAISQYGGVFIRNPELDKEEEDEDDSSQKNKPVIIIDNYVITPNIVHAGQEFDLSMTFQNTNPSKAIKNVKIFLTVSETTEKSGTVFTPVGSSNTFYEESIPPKGHVTRELKFYTVPDAEQKTYTVVVNFEYEDADGNPYTGTEQVGIPVRQEAKMQFGQLYGPEQIGFVGQQTYLMMDFFNTGRQTMFNLMVTFEGDDFTSQNPIYYVGNFDPGLTDYYETSIVPMSAGFLKGKIVFSFEDAATNPITIEKEFTMEVQEMMMDPGMDGMPWPEDPGMIEPKGPGGIMGFVRLYIWWLAGCLVIGGVVLIIVLRAKKRKKRRIMDIEDDLSFGYRPAPFASEAAAETEGRPADEQQPEPDPERETVPASAGEAPAEGGDEAG